MKMAPELRKHTTLLLHGHHHSLFYAALVDLDFFYVTVLAMWRISYNINLIVCNT